MATLLEQQIGAVFLAHGPYLSSADESELVRRLTADTDVATLAIRTCLCGTRLDGADALHAHLQAVVIEASRHWLR